MKRLAVLGLVLFGFLSFAGTASAFELRQGQSSGLAAGQTVDDDLYVVGNDVQVDGDVTRDLIVAGGTVRVTGTITGSVLVAGGDVAISGPVGGSIRAAAGTVTVNGRVGWDVVAAAGTVVIGPSATVGHDLAVEAGSVTLDGTVARDVRGTAETLRIGGQVGRNVVVRSAGDVQLVGNGHVAGSVTRLEAPSQPRLTSLGGLLLRLSWAVVAGTLLILLLPRPALATARHLERHPLPSLAWGAVLLFVIPLVAVLLAVTLVGIPVSLILLAVFLTVLYLSQILAGLALALLMVPREWTERGRFYLWLAMLIGLLAVFMVRSVPLPGGWSFWTSLIVGMLALGALWLTARDFLKGVRPGPE